QQTPPGPRPRRTARRRPPPPAAAPATRPSTASSSRPACSSGRSGRASAWLPPEVHRGRRPPRGRGHMKLSMPLSYAGGFKESAERVAALEKAGLDTVWVAEAYGDRKSTRLNSSHVKISYAVFCLK